MSDLQDALACLDDIEYRKTHYRLEYYVPYDYQKAAHSAIGKDTSVIAKQRMLMAGNKLGKTLFGGAETAFHVTGKYPKAGEHFYPEYWPGATPPVPCPYSGEDIWPNGWEGIKYYQPILALCGSNTNEQTRDIVQSELFGDPTDDALLGTGSIPVDCIGARNRKPGVPNAFDSVMVKHFTDGEFDGWSKVMFRAYEQGAKKHMGSRIDFGWMDEEPPYDIWAQYHRGTFSTKGNLLNTMTPEDSVTEVVYKFRDDLKRGQALIRAEWDDAPHMTPEVQADLLEQMSPHERDMRSKGIPIMGTGLVFEVSDEHIMIDPFPIPAHWAKICGMDYGYDHPFAATWYAFDRDTDTAYMYDVYKSSKLLLSAQADIMKKHGDWIPVAWPHDVNKVDTKSGAPLAELFRDTYGINMLRDCFSNPSLPGKKEGSGGQGVEIGLLAMLEAMEQGRLKVFKSCQDFFKEKALYHRKDGKVVRLNDDIMSAARIGYMSARFADIKPIRRVHKMTQGMTNW